MVDVFDKTDVTYLRWLKNNPLGYVINIRRTLAPSYVGLHAAGCSDIQTYGRAASNNAFTGNRYIKVCSKSVPDLKAWLRARGVSRITRVCQHCHPDIGRSFHGTTSGPAIPTLKITIPRYKGGKRPLSQAGSETPPSYAALAKRHLPVKSGRQAWFERLLAKLATVSADGRVPWSFRTESGAAYSLDKGAVGHAFANGALETPGDKNAPLQTVQVTSAHVNTEAETERVEKLKKILERKGHREFAVGIRRIYEGRCAVTKCDIAEVLQAAHILTIEKTDWNDLSNGILLRSDIHALLDAYLITFKTDMTGVEVSKALDRTSYQKLREVRLFSPSSHPVSAKSIAFHRKKFHERESRTASK